MKPTVIVFCRHPHFGVGKRRLAAGLGDGPAWRWYRRNLSSVLRKLHAPDRWTLVPAVEQAPAGLASWPAEALVQSSGHLGRRMISALNDFAPGPVVLVGSDILGLDQAAVSAMLKALQRPGLVFGPADDGGFWGIGLRGTALPITAFDKVAWSSPQTLEQCLSACYSACGPKAKTLDLVLSDVDTVDDLP